MEATALRHPRVDGLRGPTPLLRLQSDERLVALTRRGNQSAYEALVGRYQSRLLAFCRHMLGSREDAEDVLQEVFAAAYNAMVADRRPLNVRPWLYRIARNRALNHLRRVQAVGVDSMDHHIAEHGTTTADKVHRREEFRQLVADVQTLPETQRTALLLREIDALSYEQIAEAMETTIPSIKSLLVRARVSLAEAAEARHLTCTDVREELGEVAEGLRGTSPPVRRHLRGCDRCAGFRKELRRTNRGLALMLPVGPLLMLKKLVVAHAGASASAGAAASASAGASTPLAGALATKAVATVAAAAIVTAGAVEVEQVRERKQPSRAVATAPASPAAVPAPATAEPEVVASVAQPTVAARAAGPDREVATVAAPAVPEQPKADPAPAAVTPEPEDGESSASLPPSPGETGASGGVAAPAPPPPGQGQPARGASAAPGSSPSSTTQPAPAQAQPAPAEPQPSPAEPQPSSAEPQPAPVAPPAPVALTPADPPPAPAPVVAEEPEPKGSEPAGVTPQP